jgi:hypothetical protein
MMVFAGICKKPHFRIARFMAHAPALKEGMKK